jgi:tetratricopeptide (TPR) repeat protein
MTDFFISYTGADKAWAEWIALVLKAANFSVVVQAWDFRPGGNFVVEMQKAITSSERTIAVLSPDYLLSSYGTAEWAAVFAADPDGSKGKLVPVLVREVTSEGLLAPIIRINLVGLDEVAARETLVKGLAPRGNWPESVRFPGTRLFPGPPSSPPDPDKANAALAALPIEEVPQPAALPLGSRMPLSPNPLFVGREEDLKTLARQLKAGGTSAVGQVEIAAATGLGGMGKTQLASEFVHRYGRFFAGGAFWMSFADAGSVPAEVAACGRSLGLHSSFEALTLEQQVRLVQDAWQGPLPRLLVFDNCEEEGLLRHWRPTSGGARVLVTSRRPEWDPALGVQTVPLTTLPRPASIELLRRFRPDIPETERALDGIAEDLGDLPLALHLAGSFLKKYQASPFGHPIAYLESLRQTDLLANPSLQGRGVGILPTGHESHVGRTFALSFERLNPTDEADSLAIDLFSRAAWFAPGEPISRSLLLRTVRANSEDLIAGLLAEDALRRLIDLGLLETNSQKDLLMHRLVAAWALGVAEGDETRVAVEEAILTEAHRLNEAGGPTSLLALRPHLRAVTDRAMERQDRTAVRLCGELGIHLEKAGDYSGARPYLERAVAISTEVSGAEHPDTANSLNNLGGHFHHQGDYQLARSYYEKGLAIRERTLGPEHPETALSLSNLGSILQEQADYEGAQSYYERALAIQEKMPGPEHPYIAVSLSNLGLLLQARGDYEGALPYYSRALAIREKVLGPKHPDTAISLNNLGFFFQDQGDFERARSYLERSLAIFEKALGPEHPDTALGLSNLGNIFHRQGDFRRARLYLERSLGIREKVLGPEHPETASNLNSLGSILYEQGDPVKARTYLELALTIQEKVLGPEHPDTAKSLRNLGALYFDQGNFARARWHWERALQIFTARLGPNHPDTKDARRNLSLLPGARQRKKQRSQKRR